MHVLHLVASNAKIPNIEVQATDLPGEYRIRELPPNVQVTVRLNTSGLEQAKRLQEGKDVAVRAKGRVINVDPHAAVVIRMLYAIVTVLGF
jgi:hypothetical protein